MGDTIIRLLGSNYSDTAIAIMEACFVPAFVETDGGTDRVSEEMSRGEKGLRVQCGTLSPTPYHPGFIQPAMEAEEPEETNFPEFKTITSMFIPRAETVPPLEATESKHR